MRCKKVAFLKGIVYNEERINIRKNRQKTAEKG